MLHKQPGKERLTVCILSNIEAIATLPGVDLKYIKLHGSMIQGARPWADTRSPTKLPTTTLLFRRTGI